MYPSHKIYPLSRQVEDGGLKILTHFPVGFPQLEITGRLGTSNNLLGILGGMYILSRQQAFLKLFEKYFKSFTVVSFLLQSLLKIMLLFSVRSDRSF